MCDILKEMRRFADEDVHNADRDVLRRTIHEFVVQLAAAYAAVAGDRAEMRRALTEISNLANGVLGEDDTVDANITAILDVCEFALATSVRDCDSGHPGEVRDGR